MELIIFTKFKNKQTTFVTSTAILSRGIFKKNFVDFLNRSNWLQKYSFEEKGKLPFKTFLYYEIFRTIESRAGSKQLIKEQLKVLFSSENAHILITFYVIHYKISWFLIIHFLKGNFINSISL